MSVCKHSHGQRQLIPHGKFPRRRNLEAIEYSGRKTAELGFLHLREGCFEQQLSLNCLPCNQHSEGIGTFTGNRKRRNSVSNFLVHLYIYCAVI